MRVYSAGYQETKNLNTKKIVYFAIFTWKEKRIFISLGAIPELFNKKRVLGTNISHCNFVFIDNGGATCALQQTINFV